MYSKLKTIVSSGCLVVALSILLGGCESGEDPCAKRKATTNALDGPMVLDDEVLHDAAIDFISNAGDRVYFAYDSSKLSQEARSTLDRQADWLRRHPERRVLIEGHCDERGTREYNLGLGERRADAAARYLIDQGVPGESVRTISYGKDRPIAAQGSAQEINRLNRVDIAVLE